MSARLSKFLGTLRRHSELLTNAGAMAMGTFATSAVGFIFWWVAARNFAPEAVGRAAAAISTMTLIGMIGEIGLGTLLMGEGRLNRRNAPGLISASLIAASLHSIALGTGFLLIAPLIISNFSPEFSKFEVGVLFIFGCAITSFTMVLDQTLIGWLKATQQMGRNMLFSVLKLAVLAAAAFVGVAAAFQEIVIFATWVIGQLAAALLFGGWLILRGQPVWFKPEFRQLKGRIGKVFSHHFLNIVTQGPGLVLPGIVTFTVSPQTNAAFYAAFTLVNLACYVPAALATVLFTIGSADPPSSAERLRFSLRLSGLIGFVSASGFYMLSDFILKLFNPLYPTIAGTSLQLMGTVVFPVAVKYHYIAIQRLTNRMSRGGVMLAIAGAFEIGMAAIGGKWNGLSGLTVSWVVANYVEAAFMLPTIVRHLWRSRGPELVPSRPSEGLANDQRSLSNLC